MKVIALLSAALTINTISAGYDEDLDSTICAYKVKVSNAKELPDEDPDILGWFGTKNLNDVYCEVIGFAQGSNDKFKSVRTRTIDESETPQWDETFVFANNDMECGGDQGGEYDRIKFKLYDDDSIGGWSAFGVLDPQFLGETDTVYLSDVRDCVNEFAMELQVARDGTNGGSLFVVMTKSSACCSSSSSSSSSTSTSGGSSKESAPAPAPEPKQEEIKKEEVDIKKLEEEEKEIEAEIKYEEEKAEIEEKYEEEAAVETTKGKGGGGGGKNKRRLLSL